MLTTRFVTGSPNWLDLGTPDIEAANTFYGGLFGWTFQSAGPEAGGYGMFQLDGKTVAGGMAVAPEQGEPGWNVYFQIPDADATAKAVEETGGSIVFEPMDVFELGRMAIFADPAGVGFATWQPGRIKGLDAVNDPGTLVWEELYTPDPNAAIRFYSGVFGWETGTMPLPDGSGSYTMVSPAGAGPDGMFGGIVPLSADPAEAAEGPYWLPYFEVADCDAAVARATELGGKVRMAPVDLEGVGRFAKLADSAGARFAVMQSAQPES
ncbi:VOC family protein [Streptomyces sp. NBC_01142]|uniref:VOC family protein n=1 Tax=Streptomyces sp. NBC_01142 TaxID=2975865 RepID=UPI002255920B|nr:VOC family protein [Streptomyces sp. NBC_01142]MCX4820619.1 VOC family protein [Streptomyces sp. NBC_01142]